MDTRRAEVEARARAQWRQFEEALPDLIPDHADQWAVWLDGLKGTFATEEDAFAYVDANIPLHSGVVVARVEEQKATLLSSALAFVPIPS